MSKDYQYINLGVMEKCRSTSISNDDKSIRISFGLLIIQVQTPYPPALLVVQLVLKPKYPS